MATITILGSGTSDGIPQMACPCPVCASSDPRDSRLRTSALIRHGTKNILIDCGPDFRQQALQNGIVRLDAILCTHHHFDHITGLGELRPLSGALGLEIPVYANAATLEHIRARFSYIFGAHTSGGGYPVLKLIPLQARQEIAGLEVLSFCVMHGRVPIAGFRIGGLVYITDASAIPEESKALIKNCKLLIVNALREKPHSTHFSIGEACAFAEEMEAERSVLIHISHHVHHAAREKTLPQAIRLAYDGLTLEFDPN
jgi:phosphoribosyl 1,2-cyclic phosphodiesterase